MIEFRSAIDESKTATLNKHAFKRLWWLFAIISLILIGLGIMGLVMQEDESDVVYGIFCIVFGVGITPLALLLTKFFQKRINKSAAFINPETVEIIRFDDEKMIINQSLHDVFSSVTEAKYSYIYKVIETTDNYLVYISKQLCHVIDKKSITCGSLQELDDLLYRNLGDRFKAK